jgi:20S proteasome alpha/beta subunit
MTLVAAFRCRNNGILLCADREEDNGYVKRPFDKLYRISGIPQCEIFLAGSGTTTAIQDARAEIHRQMVADPKRDVLAEHRSLIEESLRIVHERNKADLKHWPLSFLIVIAPRGQEAIPALYRTDRTILISEPYYAAYGSGKPIADYFADHLYAHGLRSDLLAMLVTFIFREAEKSSSGVGLGNDMVFIHPGASGFQFLYTESIKEIEVGIPAVKDALYAYWAEHAKIPEWLRNYADSADPK